MSKTAISDIDRKVAATTKTATLFSKTNHPAFRQELYLPGNGRLQ